MAATISYRLSPRDQFPAPVLDVKTAIRFLRANAVRFNIDPAHIGVTGFSAGGHLALFLGLTAGVPEFEGPGPYREQSSKVQCVVNFYGPTDFTKSYGKSVDAAEVLPLFLGGDLEHERLAHIQASPLNWVSPNASPVLTIQGTEDRYVAYEQAVWITERLRSAGVESELLTLEGAGHGFKGADAEKAEKRLIEFLDSHLKAQSERQLLIADHGPGPRFWLSPGLRARFYGAHPISEDAMSRPWLITTPFSQWTSAEGLLRLTLTSTSYGLMAPQKDWNNPLRLNGSGTEIR